MAINLAQKVGPLPMGAWIGAGVLGVGITVMRGRSAAKTTPVSDPSQPSGGYTGAAGPGTPGWLSTAPPPALPVAGKATTNNEWATAVQTALMARNYDPVLIDAMVRDVLAANQLSVSESALYAVALRDVGPLPEILPPTGPPPGSGNPITTDVFIPTAVWDVLMANLSKFAGNLNVPLSTYTGPTPNLAVKPTTGGVLLGASDYTAMGQLAAFLAAHQRAPVPSQAPPHVTAPPAPPPPPSAPPQVSQRIVRVTKWPSQDSTLSGIAAHYHVAGGWQAIYNANRGSIKNPNLIYDGQQIRLP